MRDVLLCPDTGGKPAALRKKSSCLHTRFVTQRLYIVELRYQPP